MKQQIFITGGNGFTGSHVVYELVRHGFSVTCLVREGSSVVNLEGLPVRIVYGDITDAAGLAVLLEGFDAVIHNAAKVGDWGSRDEFYRVNVDGTRAVLEACVRGGIKKVVMAGTCSSYGEEDCPYVKDETWTDNSHYHYLFDRWFPCGMNYYRDSKALATRRAVAFSQEHGIDLIVLEPGFVYGEREFGTGFYEYVKSVKNGMRFAPGSKDNCFPVIYAGDLANAFSIALCTSISGVHRIILANPRHERMDYIFGLFCQYAGVRKPYYLPQWLLYFPAMVLECIWTILRCAHPPLMTRGRVRMFNDSVMLSSDKAKRLLGFVASTPLEVGIRRTVDWYKEHGLL